MEKKDKNILHLRFGLAILKILEERKAIFKENKKKKIKDHKLVPSIRKLAAASGIDYGIVQKITKGDQGFEFFTFIDLIDALDLDITSFATYFYSISDEQILEYQNRIEKNRSTRERKKMRSKKYKKKT